MMSYIQGKVFGYEEWTPQQLNDLIMLAYQLRQADMAGLAYDTTVVLTLVDSVVDLVDTVEKSNE